MRRRNGRRYFNLCYRRGEISMSACYGLEEMAVSHLSRVGSGRLHGSVGARQMKRGYSKFIAVYGY